MNRFWIISFLVLGLAVVSTDASAHFQIPATAGGPANANRMGGQYWEFRGDGYVRRTNSTTGGAIQDWIIPLPFHQTVPPAGNDWSVQVWASHDTQCSLQWRPNDVPTTTSDGTTPTSRDSQGMPTDGLLDLTIPSLCPQPGSGSGAVGCTTGYSTAFVLCHIQAGISLGGPTDRPPGYVGPVTYTINPHVSATSVATAPSP